MARYTSDSRERVRDAVDFVEIVGARTELRKAGARRYSGLCPFHEERTPSFGIDPVEKLYYCFGCGEGGDVFKFVMETEGLDFAAALESLADRAGVELEREAEDPQRAARRDRDDRLLALLERTAAYYVRVLWESREAEGAREYLARRGLEEGVLRQFRVGYAPSAWDKVLTASRRAGYSNQEIFAAGLATRGREGRIYDAFRGRIMFPLADRRGRVRGFGARAMRDNQGPKYVNTREGDVFSKGRQLFGVDVARAEAARAGAVILVEGYTDVIALNQAGFDNTVGMMGTALTEEQAEELGKLGHVLRLCLDADAAGQDAAMRAATALGRVSDRRRGKPLELWVVPLPPGSDPADIVATGGGADRMRLLLDGAVPFARFQVERALERPVDRDRTLAEVAKVIRPLRPGIFRDELVRLVAERLNMTSGLVESTLSFKPSAAAPQADGARQLLDRREQSERAFLALCVALPELGEAKLAALDVEAVFTAPLTRLAAERLRGRLESPSSTIPDAPELAELIPEITLRGRQLDATPAMLELEALQLDLHRLDREITAARTGGAGEVRTLAAERQKVLDAIRHRLQ